MQQGRNVPSIQICVNLFQCFVQANSWITSANLPITTFAMGCASKGRVQRDFGKDNSAMFFFYRLFIFAVPSLGLTSEEILLLEKLTSLITAGFLVSD